MTMKPRKALDVLIEMSEDVKLDTYHRRMLGYCILSFTKLLEKLQNKS